MIEERFAQGDSFLHKRDPRGKVIAAAIFTTTVALLDSYPPLFLSLCISIVLLLLTQLPAFQVAKRLVLVNGFTLFLWISLPLTYGGEQLYQLGPLELSLEGARLAAIITLKTNVIILSIISLLATSTIAQLGYSLDTLKLPKKLCFMLLYSYRYVFVIYQEYTRLLRAAQIRSFSPTTNLHTYKTYAYLFGMTLVKSYNRSTRVYQAMQLRGFNGQLVSLHRYSVTKTDLFFLIFLFMLIIGIIVIEYMSPLI